MDPARDESLIIEILELKDDVADNGSATWFLQDLAIEQSAEGTIVISFPFVFLTIYSKLKLLLDIFYFFQISVIFCLIFLV